MHQLCKHENHIHHSTESIQFKTFPLCAFLTTFSRSKRKTMSGYVCVCLCVRTPLSEGRKWERICERIKRREGGSGGGVRKILKKVSAYDILKFKFNEITKTLLSAGSAINILANRIQLFGWWIYLWHVLQRLWEILLHVLHTNIQEIKRLHIEIFLLVTYLYAFMWVLFEFPVKRKYLSSYGGYQSVYLSIS